MYDLKDIEVKGDFGEKYRGKIYEVVSDFIKLTYEDANDIICTVPIEKVYYAPYPIQSWHMSNLPELMPGTLVDVLIPNDTLPYFDGSFEFIKPKAWWPAIVKKRQGDLIVVDLLDLSVSNNNELNPNKICVLKSEIVEIDLTRFRTESITFKKHPLLSYKVDIPENLRKCFIDAKYEVELRRWCGDPVSFTKAADSSYILVMSTDVTPIHKAKLICKKWVQQWSAKFELTKQLEESRNQMHVIFEDEFVINQKLLAYALGSEYSYLKMVSQLPDVVSAQLIDNSGKFSIVAKTESAMKQAREKLEIKEEFVEFNRSLLGVLLSENCGFFSQIVQLTGLFRIMVIGDDISERCSRVNTTFKIEDDLLNGEEFVLLSLTGTQSSINISREMLEFSALNLENLLSLKSQMTEIDSELLNDVRVHCNKRSKNIKVDNQHNGGIVSVENGISHSGLVINGHKNPKSAWKEVSSK